MVQVQNYELLFNVLQEQLHRFRPRTANLLILMKDICPVETAYYAGFVLFYLHLWSEADDKKPVQALTCSDLSDFTFFEAAKENKRALVLFDRLLLCYQVEELESRLARS